MSETNKHTEFANSMRGQLIIGQALHYGVKHLKALEAREEPYPVDGEHAEPSNRADMEYLLEEVFPLYSNIQVNIDG